MKFNLPEVADLTLSNEVQVGNVYSAKGGKGTAFWVVVAVSERGVTCLGMNRAGEITSATSYGRHVFEGGAYSTGRPVLGHVAGLGDLSFDVQWRQEVHRD
ncbi:MAG: hypothetical protein KGL39_36000 [Patescibacteria group bacterium]|nr:hypothetical protein [Patescibacteria group bacterium]